VSAVTPPVREDLLIGLRRARDHIDRHYADPLELDALAALAGLSKYHFLRCFARTYGATPGTYLTERRVERAQDLLRATNLTVTEVCWLVGYSGLGSFSSRFRRLVGCSPSEYQARWARTGPPRIPGCFVLMHGLSDRATPRGGGPRPDAAIPEKPPGTGPGGESPA
jgi:AraC-like DNA-binding protein